MGGRGGREGSILGVFDKQGCVVFLDVAFHTGEEGQPSRISESFHGNAGDKTAHQEARVGDKSAHQEARVGHHSLRLYVEVLKEMRTEIYEFGSKVVK